MSSDPHHQQQTEITLHYENEILPIEEVQYNDWNPNFVPTDIRNAIKDDIQKNGFIGPIVLQKHNERLDRDNVIINGEHRFKVLKEMGGKEIPVLVLDVDDDTAMALTVRLNKEHGEMLPNKIGDLLKIISPEQDLQKLKTLTYIPEHDLKVMMDLGSSDIDAMLKAKKQDKIIAERVKIDANKQVMCPKCNLKFEVFYQ